jgi:guanylate kinase
MCCKLVRMEGKLIIFSAPSGAGKTTLVRHLLSTDLPLAFSVSATSRPPRSGEVHGKDYYFLTEEEFKQKIEEDAFLEWEEVYPGRYYGTFISELHRIWQHGKHVIFDVDVIGGLNIKKKFPNNSLAVFVKPPSYETLKERLKCRNTESDESYKSRIEKAAYELTFAERFDISIVNDNLEVSKSEALKIVTGFLKS